MNRYLRPVAFSLMGLIVVLLIVATVCEKAVSTEFAVRYFYTAPWTIALWAAATVSGMAYLFQCKMYRQVMTCLLHLSFVIILLGAMVTHLFGEQDQLHLRLGQEPKQVLNSDIQISLLDFHPDYYPGTHAPMDFSSRILLTDNRQTTENEVSMNHIATYRHYRFYQSRYDTDGQGTTLTVSHDPWGIGITYTGYALLLVSMIGFLFQSRTRFEQLLHSPLLKVLVLAVSLFGSTGLSAKTTPLPVKGPDKMTIQRPVAASMGELYVYYNNRLCPLSTLANDFCTKLYGKPRYRNLTAEQVLAGWFFYYERWLHEPIIKVKGDEVRHALHIDGKYASLSDFTGKGIYRLDPLIGEGNRNAMAADEKFQLVSMLCTGTLLHLWCPPADSVNQDEALYLTQAMNHVAWCLTQGRNQEANRTLIAIRQWQREQMVKTYGLLPVSDTRFRAEQCYNNLPYTRPLAMGCATIGLLLFIVCCWLMAKGKTINVYAHYILVFLMALIGLFLTFVLALRGVVSGHVPLSNGFETMQFLAWVTALVSIVLACRRRSGLVLASGYLIMGMTLMVSMFSSSNPQITLLMPVLQSPLLTLHVAVIMVAYCLLAFCMLNGMMALLLYAHARLTHQPKQHQDAIERLHLLSNLLLYPALFCLTTGIFIGAVWANISWGRYWGWDPKEVWALVTMLLYALPIHSNSLPFMRRPIVFHAYMVAAFAAVLFTYFGVNYLLGGMHSYA